MRFREAVAAELERRRRQNRGYSLRRFARGLGVHHTTASRLLRGARPVPARTVVTVARHLGMSPAQIAGFVAREDAAAVVDAIGRASFRPDSRWLASVAGISVDSVNIALQELLIVPATTLPDGDTLAIVADPHGMTFGMMQARQLVSS